MLLLCDVARVVGVIYDMTRAHRYRRAEIQPTSGDQLAAVYHGLAREGRSPAEGQKMVPDPRD